MTTKIRILETGMALWRAGEDVTGRRIARELDLSHGAVSYYFSRNDRSLRDAVAYYAVEQGDERVIAALVIERHQAVSHMDEATRLEYMRMAIN